MRKEEHSRECSAFSGLSPQEEKQVMIKLRRGTLGLQAFADQFNYDDLNAMDVVTRQKFFLGIQYLLQVLSDFSSVSGETEHIRLMKLHLYKLASSEYSSTQLPTERRKL